MFKDQLSCPGTGISCPGRAGPGVATPLHACLSKLEALGNWKTLKAGTETESGNGNEKVY